MFDDNFSALLLNEYPLVIIPSLAELVGLPEAIILQQIHYWIRHNEKKNINYIDGRYWMYSSYTEWQERDFAFWSISTITRHIQSLKKGITVEFDKKKLNKKPLQLLLTGNFNKKGYDRTSWYTINYDELSRLHNIYTKYKQLKDAQNSVVNDRSCSQNDIMVDSNCIDGLPNLNKPIPDNNTESTKETNTKRLSNNNTNSFDDQKGKRSTRSTRSKRDQINKEMDEIRDTFVNITAIQTEWIDKITKGIAKGTKETMDKIQVMRKKRPAYDAYFIIGEVIRKKDKRKHGLMKNILSDYDGKVEKNIKKLIDAGIDPEKYTNWFLAKSKNFKYKGFNWPFFCNDSLIVEYDSEHGTNEPVTKESGEDRLKKLQAYRENKGK